MSSPRLACSVGAALASCLAAAGPRGGAPAHACDCVHTMGELLPVPRPRNTLVWIWREDAPPSLRRVSPGGQPGEAIGLVPLGAGDLWRPARLLDRGVEYEVLVGDEVESGFAVEAAVDTEPPVFGGIKAARFLAYGGGTDGDTVAPREVLLLHDALPRDVAFVAVGVRRQGPAEAPVRQVLAVGPEVGGERRDVTVLSSDACNRAYAPPLALGETYCVTVVAHDAAGNASGGDVEVCERVTDCREVTRATPRCPLRLGSPTYLPADDQLEVPLKDAGVPGWLPGSAAPAGLVGGALLVAAWNRRRRRRVAATRWAR